MEINLDCGYDKHVEVLVFHHVDPTTKSDAISRMTNRGHSWKKILKEAEKCVLLCRNCHEVRHANTPSHIKIDFNAKKEV